MIEYRDTHEFSPEQLRRLFRSVGWSSGEFPDKLVIAMGNYETVLSAWDGDDLVGMVCAMDDGIMTAYVHYVLVDPDHQGMGIGGHLIGMLKERYSDYLRIVLIAYDTELGFYEHMGFERGKDESPCFITSLWT